MAANTGLKRLEVKYVRDKAKARYPYGEVCAICGITEPLELHHYKSVTLLWEAWKKATGTEIKDVDDVLFHRDAFIAEHQQELYVDCVTLCAAHHAKLHAIYGPKPMLHTAAKQANWVRLQKEKLQS
jgi:hypothetical protein